MSETPEDQKKPELQVDDDWKSRVKEEDAALEEKIASEKDVAPQEETASESEPVAEAVDPGQIPEANFSMLVGMFSTQAMVSLGVIPHPETGKAEKQLPLAKHFIDLLGVLEDKTVGNIDDAEQKMLNESLHNLRMAFIEMSKAESAPS